MSGALQGLALAVALSTSAAPAAPCDNPQTAENRAVMARFSHLFYDEHKVREALETYVAPDYVQHTPDMADGRDAAIAFLKPMFSRPGFKVEVRSILVDGDMAAVMVHAPGQGPTGGAFVDLYRLKAGKIVEHWDVNQIIPAHAANPHPLF